MKELTYNATFAITEFINSRSCEETLITHKRDSDGNVSVTLTTPLQPGVTSPKGRRRMTNNGFKHVTALLDPDYGDVLVFDAYYNVGLGNEKFEENSAFDLMPVYHKKVSYQDVMTW